MCNRSRRYDIMGITNLTEGMEGGESNKAVNYGTVSIHKTNNPLINV